MQDDSFCIGLWSVRLIYRNRGRLKLKGVMAALIVATLPMAVIPTFIDFGTSWPMGLIRAFALALLVLAISALCFVRIRVTPESEGDTRRSKELSKQQRK